MDPRRETAGGSSFVVPDLFFLSFPANAENPVIASVKFIPRRRRLLDRPVKPGDDSGEVGATTAQEIVQDASAFRAPRHKLRDAGDDVWLG